MFCPICGTQNLATSVRCMQCGTTLIEGTEGRTEPYRKGARMLDNRMYGGIGALLGFFLAAGLLEVVLTDLYLDERQIYGGASGGAVAGGLIGRLIAWQKWRAS